MTGFAAFAEAPAPEPTTPVHEVGTAAPDAMASELAAAEAALAAKAEEPKDEPKAEEPKDAPKDAPKAEEPKDAPKDAPKAEEPKKPARKRTRRTPAKKDDTAAAEATDPSAVTKLVGDMVDHARDASSPTTAPPVVAAKVLDENIAAMEEIAATVADSLGELKARRDAYATLLDTLG